MGDDENALDKKKAHRPRQSGVKADKKKSKTKPKDEALTARQRNPKAFAINSTQSAERRFRRKEDLTAKKQHIPVVDKTPEEPPPVLVAIVGPPKVGKTTLMNNLIKNFTRTNVVDISGPITIVTSKKRRLTLIECNNDINSMIDIAKCADLVLLLCDASFGFEMEIFEFLNICQVHGMPKIMGVLTHLDMIKSPKALKRRKKELKHRFWTEVYDGAKLFYLSGILHGEYLRNEVKNLGRFISVMKFRPLSWRGAHSYVLADRVEDVTNTEMIRQNPKCDREVILYGYVRGVPMNKESMVHLAGVGDLRINELSALSDPCPLPGSEKKRNLLEKERLLYAPMSGVGGIVYDKDAVYIELQGSHSHREKANANPEQDELVSKLKEKKQTVDMQIEEQEFRLFSDGQIIKSKNFKEAPVVKDESESDENEGSDSDQEDVDSGVDDKEGESDAESDEEEMDWQNQSNGEQEEQSDEEDESSDEEYQNQINSEKVSNAGTKSDNAEESSDEDEEDKVIQSNLSWKSNLAQRARDAYLERQSESKSLMRLVYGAYSSRPDYTLDKKEIKKEESDSEDEIGGLFKVVADEQSNLQTERSIKDLDETCFFQQGGGEVRDWLSEENKELIKNCFVTGKWRASEDAEELLKLDDLSDDDSEIYGDFEDLETGEKHNGERKSKKSSSSKEVDIEDDDDDPEDKEENTLKRKMTRVEEENMTKSELMAKKMKLKARFDAEYDNKDDSGRITGDHDYYESLKAEAQRQSELNKSEFSHLDEDIRLQVEGHRAGLYVRIGFKNIPAEFIQHLDTSYPILIGGLNMAEENIGYVNCKIKKHRWYKKILKTGDPLIISLGWRRFQTIPIYAKIEDDLKHRYLKYTPNHVTCSMTFWGPITPQNTGFLALQSVQNDRAEMKRIGLRIAATGCVTEMDKSTQIMKKLKLVGTPFKIYKKSAFIKGMFNSSLEVAKFEGARIKTVSGIRGQIKKAHANPEGSFRATFEDKILLSDIVFCRTWFRVDVPKFYTPVTSLLLSPEEKAQWQGMKTLGQLKRERNLRAQPNEDNLYTDIKREPKRFKPLNIPKSLQRALPYKYKPKQGPVHPKKSIEDERIAVIRSPHEQKIAKMMTMLKTNYQDKRQREKAATKQRVKEFKMRKQVEEMRKLKRQKELRKKVSRAISKMNHSEKSTS